MEKNRAGIKTSSSERRKKFGQWFSPKMYRESKGIILQARPGVPEKISNIMSYADRRRLNLPQDEALDDYQKDS